jgi:hypothetical protein
MELPWRRGIGRRAICHWHASGSMCPAREAGEWPGRLPLEEEWMHRSRLFMVTLGALGLGRPVDASLPAPGTSATTRMAAQ